MVSWSSTLLNGHNQSVYVNSIFIKKIVFESPQLFKFAHNQISLRSNSQPHLRVKSVSWGFIKRSTQKKYFKVVLSFQIW